MLNPAIPDKEFFSIGEVTDIVQIRPYVLRYWESEFKLLRPARRGSGQRKYTKKDIQVVFTVKDLLYARKFTIAGAKKELVKELKKKNDPEQLDFNLNNADAKLLVDIRNEISDLLKMLHS